MNRVGPGSAKALVAHRPNNPGRPNGRPGFVLFALKGRDDLQTVDGGNPLCKHSNVQNAAHR